MIGNSDQLTGLTLTQLTRLRERLTAERRQDQLGLDLDLDPSVEPGREPSTIERELRSVNYEISRRINQ